MMFLKKCLQLLDRVLFHGRFAKYQIGYTETTEYKALKEKAASAEKIEWANERDANDELDNKCTAAIQAHKMETDKATGKLDTEIRLLDEKLKDSKTPPTEPPPPRNPKYPRPAEKKAQEEYLAAKKKWEQDRAKWQAEKEKLEAEKNRLEEEHKAVKQSMETMRDVAKHKAKAAITARENAKKDAGEKIEKILEEKDVPEEIKQKLQERLKHRDRFKQEDPIDYLGGTHEWTDPEGNKHSVNITDMDLHAMVDGMLAGYDGEMGEDFHKFLYSDFKGKAEEKEWDEGQHMGDVQTLAIKYGGYEGGELSDAWEIAQDLAVSHHKLGAPMAGMLLGRLASAPKDDPEGRQRVLDQLKKRIKMLKTMAGDKNRPFGYRNYEKAFAVLEAFDEIDALQWDNAVAEYEAMKAAIGDSAIGKAALKTAAEIVSSTGENKQQKILKAKSLSEAVKAAESTYRSELLSSLLEDQSYKDSLKIYEYYGIEGSHPAKQEADKIKAAGNDLSLAEYKARCDALKSSIGLGGASNPELQQKAAAKREELNKKIAEIKTYQEFYKEHQEAAEKEELPTVAFEGDLNKETDPAKIRDWYEANKEKVAAAHKTVDDNKEKLVEVSKKKKPRRVGGGSYRPPARPSQKPQPAPKGPSKLAKLRERLAGGGTVEADWKDKKPEGYKDKPADKAPEWVAKWEEKDNPSKSGYVELRYGKDHVVARVEKKDNTVKVEYYPPEEKPEKSS